MYDAAALLAGDEAALADAIDALTPELYRYAAGILLSAADASDAVQTAFVRLWTHRKSVREPSAVRHIFIAAHSVPAWIFSAKTAFSYRCRSRFLIGRCPMSWRTRCMR